MPAYGDRAHGQLLSSGWRWVDATEYHSTVGTLTLRLVPLANVSDEMPTEERFDKQRRGRWTLHAGNTIVAAFDTLVAAAVAVLVGAAYRE